MGQILKSEINFFTMSKREEIRMKNVQKGKITLLELEITLGIKNKFAESALNFLP
ncbi:MAG: hypothetical protein PHW06_04135 [Candidatus Cloacimonas acidaminovorans]|nr:hypothetical protein [Candidatus Cloacimonas acidaminovorans]HPI42450.1 hypothetical protein [Candidatus Cloacimonas acidaminovorans]HQC08528.1 hypothetical protein [Candidatus Cloacimonas acidaminovorans]HQF35533.1 hypothetical protein [Candidatus Cloacimonas acidaminovorans]HQJ17178.1 hypothetical protein [Candidatus Cloacimonas acidaminovorans]